MPRPSAILVAKYSQWHTVLRNAVPTALESLAGFIISVVAGGLLGILLTFSRIARDALYPPVVLFQLIPKVAMTPLFMLSLGIQLHSRVSIMGSLAFFPVVISPVSAL